MSDLKGPALFEIRQFIKDKALVEFHTVNDKTFKGQIIWYDNDAFHINLENDQQITLIKNSIVYYSKIQG